MTLIEKIAKALHDDLASEAASQDGHKRYWETAPIQVKMLCRRQARVALEAMYAPPAAIIEAGHSAVDIDVPVLPGWYAMIEAALNEKDT